MPTYHDTKEIWLAVHTQTEVFGKLAKAEVDDIAGIASDAWRTSYSIPLKYVVSSAGPHSLYVFDRIHKRFPDHVTRFRLHNLR